MTDAYSLAQRLVSELLGTAVLTVVGSGSVVAALVLSADSTPALRSGDLLGIAFAFGFVITAIVYTLGKVSGAHINPGVTLALIMSAAFPRATCRGTGRRNSAER